MKSKKQKLFNFIKAVTFLALFGVIFLKVTDIFGISSDLSEHGEMMVNGFYELEEDSADMVIIGNSHVYRGWQPAFAWKEYGIASTAWSTSDLPYGVVKNVAIETLKTQDPKVLVLDISPYINKTDGENNQIYLLIDNMRFSYNYVDMIRNYINYAGVTDNEKKLQYILPFYQFHTRWDSLNEGDFKQTQISYLNSCYEEKFLSKAVTEYEHGATDKRRQVSPLTEEALRDLLEWCKKEQNNREILFFYSPTVVPDKRREMVNYVEDIVKEYGFEIVNFDKGELYEKCELDDKTDYQDYNHVNVIGSYKLTKVFSEYLIEKYDLPTHKGEEAYKDWDAKADQYYKIVAGYQDMFSEEKKNDE